MKDTFLITFWVSALAACILFFFYEEPQTIAVAEAEPVKTEFKGRDMEGCGGDLYFKDQLNIWWVMLKEGGGGALNGPWKAKVQQVSDQKFGGWWKFCDVGGYQYAID